MKALILAAGRGSRLGNLTNEIPKCLVKLHGKHLIEWQINSLFSGGITEIGIVTGYKSNLLERFNLVEFKNILWQQTNMIYSLVCADSWLDPW